MLIIKTNDRKLIMSTKIVTWMCDEMMTNFKESWKGITVIIGKSDVPSALVSIIAFVILLLPEPPEVEGEVIL